MESHKNNGATLSHPKGSSSMLELTPPWLKGNLYIIHNYFNTDRKLLNILAYNIGGQTPVISGETLIRGESIKAINCICLWNISQNLE